MTNSPTLQMPDSYAPATARKTLDAPDYSKAASGMKLNMPLYQGEGNYAVPTLNQPGVEVLDAEWYDKWLKDETGKYIGSTPLPKVGQQSTGQPATIGSVATTPPPEHKNGVDWKGVGEATAQAASSALADVSKAKGALARNEYNNDLRYWQEQGKYWFDPNANLKPDLEKYLSEMPSATDSLSKGGLTGGKMGDAGHAVVEPTGFVAGKIAEGIGGEKWKGAGQYASNKALEGAATGFAAGGWIGAIGGAALGAVMGVFTWSSAVDEDKKRNTQAASDFEKRLKEWTVNRNRRMAMERRDSHERRKVEDATRKAEKSADDARTASGIREVRQNMANVFMNAGRVSGKNRAERMQRWGR